MVSVIYPYICLKKSRSLEKMEVIMTVNMASLGVLKQIKRKTYTVEPKPFSPRNRYPSPSFAAQKFKQVWSPLL